MDTYHSSPLTLCYIPALLPDEQLYSYLARIGLHNGLAKTRYYPRFFGTKGALPILDLPTKLTLLQNRLGPVSPFESTSDLIERATIYPYHRPFLSPERHELVQRIIEKGNGNGLKAVLGRLANRFGANPALRYCPDCMAFDTACYGSPYWHRAHQLPGVSSCFEHGRDLRILSLPHEINHKTTLFLPPAVESDVPRRESERSQVDFARLSAQILWSALPPIPSSIRAEIYREAVASRGFEARRKINYVSLSSAIRLHYDNFSGFLHQERLLATAKTPLSWVRSLIDRPERASHPICHITFIGFTFRDLDTYIAALAHQVDTATDARHASEAGDESHLKQTQYALTDVGRSCRALAKDLRLSVTTIALLRRQAGIPISERRKTLTPNKIEQIVDGIRQGLSPMEIAERSNVSLSTVYRQRQIHKHEVDRASARLLEQERRTNRSDWMKAIASTNAAALKSIRASAPATYAWLYRNDRTWLMNTCVQLHRKRPSRATADWPKRDMQMCEKLGTYVASVRASACRPRISRSLMTNYLGDATIRANRHLLPELSRMLDCLEEPPLSYQLYRIDRALEILAEKGYPNRLWCVRKLAGMRKWTATHYVYARWRLNTKS